MFDSFALLPDEYGSTFANVKRTSFIISVGLLAFVWSAALPQICHAEAKGAAYSDVEADKHKGEDAAVTGKVTGVSKSAKGTTFINFGARYPNHTFTGIVFPGDVQKVGDLSALANQMVTVTGRIEAAPDGKPQIVIKSLDQITIPKTPQPDSATPPPAPPVSAPSTPPAPVSPTPPAATNPTPASVPQPTPSPKSAAAKRIALAENWTTAPQSGEMTRKDLATIFGAQATSGESAVADALIVIYPEVPYLAPLATARKQLNLDNTSPTRTKIVTPGLPADSLTANTFAGIFPGGFTSMTLITDTADQVVSVLLLDDSPRQRTTEITELDGFHTYNFILNRAKSTAQLVIKHELTREGASAGVVVVESLLINPNAADPAATPRPATRGSTVAKKPRTGKVIERSRWFVPKPLVSIILRASGNR